MNQPINAPSFPESVTEGTIAAWHKRENEPCLRDELIVDIETEKIVLEVCAPADGYIAAIYKKEGDTVASAEKIGDFTAKAASGAAQQTTIHEATTAGVSTPPAPEQNIAAQPAKAGPAARKAMAANNIDPSKVTASGKSGAITKTDVNHFLQTSAVRIEKRVPMTRMRASIAKRLVAAQHNAAMLTTFNEVDMLTLMRLRNTYKELYMQRFKGAKLSYMAFFVKATTEALKRFSSVNASLDGNDIVYHGYQDIGVAVSTEKGLVVPILRDANSLHLSEIEIQIADYAQRARDNKLTMEEMQGGTFTITNGGVFGSLLSTPILNPPQTAILGMHAIKERPVVVDGEIVIRPIMNLALSYDHRLIDGREAVQFLVAIKDMIEDPARILLDI